MQIFERYSYEDYLDRALSDKPTKHERYSRKIDPFHTKWCGSPSFDVAAKLALQGWQEGRELVGQILTQVESEMEVSSPTMVWDVTGDFVDIGAFVNGEPECMMHWEEVPAKKRVARLLVNLSVSSGVSTQVIRWRGATVLALIDRLESCAIRVELDMAWSVRNYDNDTAVFVINLKRPEEPLHLDLMAFHLTHPSSLRRIFLSFVEHCPDEVIAKFGFRSSGNYGVPTRINDLIPEGEKYDLILPEMHLDTVKAALAEIENFFNIITSVKEGDLYEACSPE